MSVGDLLGGRKLILGSGSAGRRQLLDKWGWDFEVVTADVDEKAIRYEDPEKLTLALAKAKAEAVVPLVEGPALVITSDTVIYQDGMIIEKPGRGEEARRLFENYKTSPVYCFTAVAVSDNVSGRRIEGVDSTEMFFSEIPEDIIEELVVKEETYKRAGGFTTDEPLIKPYIKEIRGEEETVIGLPRQLTESLIKQCMAESG